MKCEVCGCEHDGSYGSGRFCSINCKQKFVGIGSDKQYVCKFCGETFSTPTKLGGHIVRCKLNPTSKNIIEYTKEQRKILALKKNPIVDRIVKCKKCGKMFHIRVKELEFKRGEFRKCCSVKCAHFRLQSKEIRDKKRTTLRKTLIEKSRETNRCAAIKYRVCKVCGNKFRIPPVRSGKWRSLKFCSRECSAIHKSEVTSHFAKLRCARGEFGGINKDAYRKSKKGWYHGIYCGSSWELAFVIYHLDIGDKVVRCQKKLPYIYEGRIFNYYPDFDIGETTYEIKGYEDKKAKAKQEQYPEIVVLRAEQMKTILKYVTGKYGKDFVRLLEKTGS